MEAGTLVVAAFTSICVAIVMRQFVSHWREEQSFRKAERQRVERLRLGFGLPREE